MQGDGRKPAAPVQSPEWTLTVLLIAGVIQPTRRFPERMASRAGGVMPCGLHDRLAAATAAQAGSVIVLRNRTGREVRGQRLREHPIARQATVRDHPGSPTPQARLRSRSQAICCQRGVRPLRVAVLPLLPILSNPKAVPSTARERALNARVGLKQTVGCCGSQAQSDRRPAPGSDALFRPNERGFRQLDENGWTNGGR